MKMTAITWKIVTLLTFTLAAFSGFAQEEARLISDETINKVKNFYPNVDVELFSSANQGNINAVLAVSDILLRSNDEVLVKQGIDLLVDQSKHYAIARLHLGLRYLEGIEVIPAVDKPKRIARDYALSIQYLKQYLADPIDNNPPLFGIAFTALGSAYIKNENYQQAVDHFLSNIALIKEDPRGISAYELAGLYRDGNGVDENKEQAFYWYDIAAKKGLNMAIMERNFLAIELGKESGQMHYD